MTIPRSSLAARLTALERRLNPPPPCDCRVRVVLPDAAGTFPPRPRCPSHGADWRFPWVYTGVPCDDRL